MTMLSDLNTPAAVIDRSRMQNNIDRMQSHLQRMGVRLRPHVKTGKCIPMARAQVEAGARGITVSTLREAEQFFAAGFNDILYAVCIVPAKLGQVLSLVQRGCLLRLITDSAPVARDIGRFAHANGIEL